MENSKIKNRLARKNRIRKKIKGDSERPRLTVYKSLKHIYAQVI
ncbi:MAG: 50S ribosomal protein L18, partial [Nitrospinae bacterium]|nr:50S ribosomal protein L18 [Nitrospinota bacterium]